MYFKQYKSPSKTGWLGWIENAKGRALAFVRLDGEVVFDF